MMRSIFLGIAALFSLSAAAQTAHTAAELRAMAQEQNGSVISIHDPSVVYRGGQYYVWGSHLGVAKSTDLIQWTGLNADASTFRRLANPGDAEGTNCTFADAFNHQQVVRTVNCDGAEADLTLVDAENFCNWYATDKENHINGNMWAPDIIYNVQMKKWCMYLSLNGDQWASVIILLTSSTATGPFTYQGPVVMSGFNGDAAAPSYQLTDLELACGSLASLPARYKQQGKWGSYWPNCIDPCVFYDEEGQLWMAYGSWSGGIWLLRLNNATGLRDYTYHPASNYATAGASVTADPYFGTRIAGGHYVSGEGSYIQHIGDYYYLFMSYGGYAPDGGYDMRIFRSTQPEGPYTDASGNTATYTEYQLNYGPTANTNRGMHLIGAYNQWGGVQNVGECAQGHNSACTDDKGRSFVVYHTKFNDGSVGHQVRVHQLFVNEKGWLVAAPFCYRGETEQMFTADEVVGDYHMLLHPYKLDHSNYQEQTEQTLTLAADGTVKGAYTGTWQLTGDKLTIKLGATTYYGVVCPQHINGATTQNYKTTELAAVAFTAMAQNGVPVWGYKLEPASAVAWNYTQHAVPVKNAQVINSNIPLMYATTDNTTLTWTSSEPDVISPTGRFAPAQDIVPVTLTARLECADHYWEEAFNVKAQKETFPSGDWLTGLVGYFTFDETPVLNQYKPATETDYAKMTIGRLGSGVKPELASDWEHDYLHTYFGVQGNNSYARVANPLYGRTDVEGFSVSAWLRRNDNNLWDGIWGFFNSTVASASSPRFFLTGNAYVGYNDNAGVWADVSKPEADDAVGTGVIPVGSWAFVTVTVGATNGVRVYVDGANQPAASIACSTGATTARALPAADMATAVAAMKYCCLGMGSFWGSADVCIDDLLIHDRELSSTDVRAVYQMANRVYDYTQGEGGTAIVAPWAEAATSVRKGLFNLQGQPLQQAPSRGCYIRDGRVMVNQ